MDADRRLGGHVHAAAGPQHRDRRAAVDPTRARRHAVRSAVGHRRLRAQSGGAAFDRGRPRRPAGPTEDLCGRHRDLHHRVAAVRRRIEHAVPHARPRGPGHRRRDHVLDFAGAARQRVQGPRPRHRVRRVGRNRGHCGSHRPGARGRYHLGALVALDLSRKRAAGRRDPRRDAAARGRVAGSRCAAARPDRLRHLLERAVLDRVRLDRVEQQGLGFGGGGRLPRRRRRDDGGVLRLRGAPASVRCST